MSIAAIFEYMIWLILLALLIWFWPENKENSRCDQHTWVYKDNGDGNEYLVCAVCKNIPEIDSYEEGDDW